jgi:hypothetical protein
MLHHRYQPNRDKRRISLPKQKSNYKSHNLVNMCYNYKCFELPSFTTPKTARKRPTPMRIKWRYRQSQTIGNISLGGYGAECVQYDEFTRQRFFQHNASRTGASNAF